MKKSKIYLFIGIISMLLLTGLSIYAAFYFSNDYGANVDYGNVKEINFSDNNKSENLLYKFKKAGDAVIYEYSINNPTNDLVNYNFYLSTNDNKNSLQSSILVYYANNPLNKEDNKIDYKFAGTLSNLTDDKVINYLLDNNCFLAKNDTRNFKLKLVLHNSSAINKEYSSSIKLNCKIENCNASEYSVIKNESDLTNVLFANNKYDLNKEIVLANDVNITEEIEITKKLTINLNGHTLSGAQINVKNNINIVDNYNGIITNDIILNDDSAFIWFDDNITLPNTITLTKYDNNELKKKIDGVFNSFVLKEKINIYGNNSFYDTDEFEGDGYTYNRGLITKTATKNLVTTITINSNNYDFKIESYTDYESTIINTGLSHIKAYDNTGISENLKEISFDLYLPTFLPEYNATIIWNSSDESILSNTGYADESGEVTLYATIEYDGNAFNTSFRINVVKQNNETRFEYLLSKIGTINFTSVWDAKTFNDSQGGIKLLATNLNYVEMLDMEDIGIHSISYSVDPMYHYLSIGSYENEERTIPYLYLNAATFDKFALLTVHVEFIEDPENKDGEYKEYVGNVNVTINLKDNDQLLRQVMDYVTSYIDKQNVLQNMLDTRVKYGISNEKGDFVLPSEYMGYSIRYVYRKPDASKLDGVYSITDNALLYNGRVYTAKDNKFIIDGNEYSLNNGYITINTKYEINNNEVIVNDISYLKKRYVKVPDTNNNYLYYEIIEPNDTIANPQVKIGDIIRDVNESDEVVSGFIIDGIFYPFTNNGDVIIVPVKYKTQQAVIVNPEKFDSTEKSIAIDVELTYEGRPVASTTTAIDVDDYEAGKKHNNYTPPAFTIPAAIHSDSNNTFNQVWFPLIKYQVLQQSNYTVKFTDENVKYVSYDNNTYIYNEVDKKLYSSDGKVNTQVTVIDKNGVLGIERGGWKPLLQGGYPLVTKDDVTNQGDYMLMYDILCTDTIVIEGHNKQYSDPIPLSDLRELNVALNWATGEAVSTCSLFEGKNYSWIQANGEETISDYEQYALIEYFKDIPWFDQILKYFLYGNNIKENIITEEAENNLRALVSDKYFYMLTLWATSLTTNSAKEYLFGDADKASIISTLEINEEMYSYLEAVIDNISDGNITISNAEEQVILRYIMSKYNDKYSSFYDSWTNNITRIDNEITQNINNTNTNKNLEYMLGKELTLDVFDTIKAWATYYGGKDKNGFDNAYIWWTNTTTSNSTSKTNAGTSLSDFFTTKYGKDNALKILKLYELEGNDVKDIKNGYAAASATVLETVYDTCDMFTESEAKVLNQFITSLGIAKKELTINKETIAIGDYIGGYEEKAEGSTYDEASKDSKAVFEKYGYSTAKASSTYIITKTKDITVSTLSTANWDSIRDQVETAADFKNSESDELNNVLTWATGTEIKDYVPTNGYSYTYTYLLSDGKETISYEEYLLINEFVSKLDRPVSFKNNILSIALGLDDNGLAFRDSSFNNTIMAAVSGTLGLKNAVTFEDFIENAKKLDSSLSNNAIYDGLPTLSFNEYKKLLDIVPNGDELKNEWDQKVNTYFKYIAIDDNPNIRNLSSKDDFINRIKTIKKEIYYIVSQDNLNGQDFKGLKYFVNLENFYGRNLTGEAKLIFDTVTGYTNATTIELSNSGLDDISSLNKVNGLKYLDISNNNTLSDISVLNTIDLSALAYLNIRGTNVDIRYNITTLDNIYTNYVSGSVLMVRYPDIRYTDNINNIGKVYVQDSEHEAMRIAFLLKEISSLNGTQLLLPSQIVYGPLDTDVLKGNDIIWKIESGDCLKINLSGKVKYLAVDTSKFSDEVNKLSCVVSVTVRFNNVTYTRYFNILVNYKA